MKQTILLLLSLLLCCIIVSCADSSDSTISDTSGAAGTTGIVTDITTAESESDTYEETEMKKQFTNLFAPSEAEVGWYNASGDSSADSSFYSSPPISVEPGDVIYFGAAVNTQGWHIVLYNDKGNAIGDGTVGKNIFISEEIEKTTSIMHYTVEKNVTSIRMVCDARCFFKYLVTKNEPFTTDEYYDALSLEKPIKKEFVVNTDSPLYNKTAFFCGDSLCYGQWDDMNRRAWAGRIAEQYGMKVNNAGIGGTALSTIRGKNAQIVNQIKNAGSKTQYDYVILEGGVNDAWGVEDNGSYKYADIGNITDSFNREDFDTSTFAGGLEELFYYARKCYPDAIIGYIFTFYMPNATGIGHVSDMEEYYAEAKKICEKWDIPYLDLYHDDYVSDELMEVTTGNCLQDPIHPNIEGYNRLAPYIATWMETMKK